MHIYFYECTRKFWEIYKQKKYKTEDKELDVEAFTQPSPIMGVGTDMLPTMTIDENMQQNINNNNNSNDNNNMNPEQSQMSQFDNSNNDNQETK